MANQAIEKTVRENFGLMRPSTSQTAISFAGQACGPTLAKY
jgi:hypothetical protein